MTRRSRIDVSDAITPLDLEAHALDAAMRNASKLSVFDGAERRDVCGTTQIGTGLIRPSMASCPWGGEHGQFGER
jgi:hypothetical protein